MRPPENRPKLTRHDILRFARACAAAKQGLFHAGKDDRQQPNLRDWAETEKLDVGGGRMGYGKFFSEEVAALMRRGFIVRWRAGERPTDKVWYSLAEQQDPEAFALAQAEAKELGLRLETSPAAR
ncbi:hypothetical protein [Vulgatibacter sp.]|uniref:hypothetical protein n=1 Tax=Vulgatibacter sp. TaxID=1971226 RepID=UPI0035627F04